MKPPTTLIVAIISATKAIHAERPGSPPLNSVFERIRAPTIVIPEIALVKAMWAYGNSKNSDEIKALMLKNIASEF